MKRITALAISVIMMCNAASCGKKEDHMHTYEATVNGEPFRLSYPLEKSDGTMRTDEEISDIDKSVSKALTDALFIFSEENSAGVGEINKSVDAVLNCSSELTELINYTYSVSNMTGGKYQPVFGAVTELYKSGAEVTQEALSEAMTHTGLSLISIEDGNIRKSDRAAKLDYDSISAGYALADAAAVLSVKRVDYAVLTYKNTVTSCGEPQKGENVDVAVYLSEVGENYSGILSFKNAVVTTCNKKSLVLDSSTGERVDSEHDTVIVICSDGILSNALVPVLYGMSAEEIQRLYDSKAISFEAVVIDADGEFYKTSDSVLYEKSEEKD